MSDQEQPSGRRRPSDTGIEHAAKRRLVEDDEGVDDPPIPSSPPPPVSPTPGLSPSPSHPRTPIAASTPFYIKLRLCLPPMS